MQITRNAQGVATHITMRKPLDMHQHLRDGMLLDLVAPLVASRFAEAIAMPNLIPPITTADMAVEYRRRIRTAVGTSAFQPLMTLYLTDTLDPNEVRQGIIDGVVHGIKYYPRGLTTNSDSGVADPSALWTEGTRPYECLRVLAEHRKALFIHAADGVDQEGVELDPYEQESHFMRQTFPEIVEHHLGLNISVEHLSTAEGADMIRHFGHVTGGDGDKNDPLGTVGCSLTPHHLLLARKDVFKGGFRTHRSWMPVIQDDENRQALRQLASEGHRYVWLGSDSAPHPRSKKEADCCASGVLTAHAAIELYAEAFEDIGCLDERFEKFASINGPIFLGRRPSNENITLVREDWRPQPLFYAHDGELMGRGEIVPFRSYKDDQPIRWKLA